MARRFVLGRSRDGVDPACRLDERLLGRTGAVGRVGQYRADAPPCHRVRSTGWRHGGRGRLHGRSGHRTRRLRTVGHASPSWPIAHRIGHGIGVHIFQSLVLTTVAVARCAELSLLGRPTRWSEWRPRQRHGIEGPLRPGPLGHGRCRLTEQRRWRRRRRCEVRQYCIRGSCVGNEPASTVGDVPGGDKRVVSKDESESRPARPGIPGSCRVLLKR